MALGICLITSCAKEDNIFTDDGNGGANGIVELGDLAPRATSTAFAAAIPNSYDAEIVTVDLPITVNYSGVNGAPEDVTVTMAISNDVTTAFNTGFATTYQSMPTRLYTVPSYTVTIPKGKKSATFIIKVLPSSFTAADLSLKYAFGIKIASTSKGIVSGNYGSGLWPITVKNKYDGVYSVTGSIIDYTNAAFAGTYPQTVHLVTTGANTNVVNYFYIANALNRYYFLNGTSATYYGNWCPIFTFNLSTNAVTSVTNVYGQNVGDNSNERSGRIDNTTTYYYDPATKKITIVYYLIQAGAIKTKFTEVYTYTKAR